MNSPAAVMWFMHSRLLLAACKAITHRFPLERCAEAVLTLKDSHRTGRSEGPARTWPLAAEQCRCAASLLCG